MGISGGGRVGSEGFSGENEGGISSGEDLQSQIDSLSAWAKQADEAMQSSQDLADNAKLSMELYNLQVQIAQTELLIRSAKDVQNMSWLKGTAYDPATWGSPSDVSFSDITPQQWNDIASGRISLDNLKFN